MDPKEELCNVHLELIFHFATFRIHFIEKQEAAWEERVHAHRPKSAQPMWQALQRQTWGVWHICIALNYIALCWCHCQQGCVPIVNSQFIHSVNRNLSSQSCTSKQDDSPWKGWQLSQGRHASITSTYQTRSPAEMSIEAGRIWSASTDMIHWQFQSAPHRSSVLLHCQQWLLDCCQCSILSRTGSKG